MEGGVVQFPYRIRILPTAPKFCAKAHKRKYSNALATEGRDAADKDNQASVCNITDRYATKDGHKRTS